MFFLIGLCVWPIRSAFCQNLPEVTIGMYHSVTGAGARQINGNNRFSDQPNYWNPGLYVDVAINPEYSFQSYTGYHRYGFKYLDNLIWRNVKLTEQLHYISNTSVVRYATRKVGVTGGFQFLFLHDAVLRAKNKGRISNKEAFYKFRAFPSVGLDWAAHRLVGLFARIQGGVGQLNKEDIRIQEGLARIEIGYWSLEMGVRVNLYSIPYVRTYQNKSSRF